MRFIKRIFLFLVVNLLVITTISVVLNLLNVRPYLNEAGISYTDLMIFCLVWGFGGAFISLGLSRIMAKTILGVKVIKPAEASPEQHQLLDVVHRLAQKAHLPEMPEVGIYKSAEVNAFATGPTRRRSLVAVSSGLLDHMNQNQLEGVLAHEITHIANGDMVTMTLLQGIVNAFVMFLARVLALVFSGFGRGERRGSSGSYFLFTMLFQSVFMILGSLIVFWFSRRREYRADAGGAHLAGKEKMISALEKLKQYANQKVPSAERESLQTLKISSPGKTGWALLFMSHPPLEMRIQALKH